MPHVIVKMYAGRTEQEKVKLAEEVAKAVRTAIGSADKSISVAIEDVAPDEWAEKVYRPDIKSKWDAVYKKPGYDPL
ncbi:tautomerase family protein [Microvirga sp. M2]|uniref:tautomerase family protein n=1 Tax=Microvirga sp. M2 TaxID=3073270 RepID=UPI0039C29B14